MVLVLKTATKYFYCCTIQIKRMTGGFKFTVKCDNHTEPFVSTHGSAIGAG